VLQERLADTVALGILVVLGLAFGLPVQFPSFAIELRILLPIAAIILGLVCPTVLIAVARRPPGSTNAVISNYRLVVLGFSGLSFLRSVLDTCAETQRSPRLWLVVAAASAGMQAMAVGAAAAVLLGFGVDAPLTAGLLIVVMVNLGLGFVPSPLGFGLYQAAGLIALGSYTSSELAVAAATAFQAVTYSALVLAAVPAVVGEFGRTLLHDGGRTGRTPAADVLGR
jgi:hypothetical protein